MKKALFFDLDGTLWNALQVLCESWNEAMEKENKHYRFDLPKMQSYMGLTPLETVELGFNDVPVEEGMRLFNICLEAEVKYMATHPGTMYPFEEEVIKELASKYDLYIVSNCGNGYIENYLNALNMKPYFKDIANVGKPKDEKWLNILYLKERDNIDDIIYIGDTQKDKNESNKAGVKFIHANYGFGVIENDEYYIDSLKDLPIMVEKLFHK
ncbi:MAG: HAD family hydrolase [Bacilli bacterium]|nr:HAD family hydrolase [Bacilli bacterium]